MLIFIQHNKRCLVVNGLLFYLKYFVKGFQLATWNGQWATGNE